MSVYFISDFHLGAPWIKDKDNQARLFLDFLEYIAQDVEYLYILGDLFDFWFEYRDGFPNKFPEITSKLKELSDGGVKIKFLGGNHDWWVGKSFISLTGADVIKTDTEVSHYGKRIYISHGDGVAKPDWAYRLLRRILRNRVNIFLFSQLPSSIGIILAKIVSSGSRARGEGRSWSFLPYYVIFAESLVGEGFDAVIMGHTHIPQVVEFQDGVYINIGDWIRYFTYCKLDDGGFRLRSFADGTEGNFDFSKLTPPKGIWGI